MENTTEQPEVQIILSPKKAEEIFHNALCNECGMFASGSVAIDYSQEDYIRAKENILAQGISPCIEDVLLQILKDGGTLTTEDQECEEGEDSEYNVSITLADVHARVGNTPIEHLTNVLTDNDGAETADVVLQTVFFQEVIFG